MPAKKCENGKWKWGESGSCVYDSKKDAEDANSDYRDERDVKLNVTEGMKEEAARGKAWREEFGRGGTEVGLKTANMILSNSMTEDRVRLDDSIKTLKYLIKIQTNRFKEIVKNKLLWIYPSWI